MLSWLKKRHVREPWFSGDDPYWLKEVLLSGGTLKTRERVWCVGLRSCGASSPWKRGEKMRQDHESPNRNWRGKELSTFGYGPVDGNPAHTLPIAGCG